MAPTLLSLISESKDLIDEDIKGKYFQSKLDSLIIFIILNLLNQARQITLIEAFLPGFRWEKKPIIFFLMKLNFICRFHKKASKK